MPHPGAVEDCDADLSGCRPPHAALSQAAVAARANWLRRLLAH
jgi:hypothetical protein